MRKFLQLLLIVVVIALIVIQFFKPEKNASAEIATEGISAKHAVPENVQQILKVSCYDCHSSNTVYPWYAKIQPASWFLANHIADGKKQLNFSIFSTYSAARRYKKFKEIAQQVKDNEMPLFSYTIIHRDAVLNPDQKSAIENWAATSMKEMELQYPTDSLVRKKK